MAETVEIFRSANVLVRHAPQVGAGTLVISFGPWRSKPALELEGFGEAFLAEHGIDAVFVTCASNRWYQYPEMPAALAAIEAVAAPYARRITYGSSMGAFAALAFSRALRAQRVIAISPQYAVGAAQVPFETRWSREAAAITWRHRLAEGLSETAEIVVLYDPLHLDRQHVDLLRRHRPITAFALPFAGHPAGEMLREVRLISRVALGLIHAPQRLPDLRRQARQLRGRSALYWSERARAFAARERFDRALEAAERAASLAPGNPRLHHVRGQIALRVGDLAKAVESFTRVARHSPQQVEPRLTLARALHRAGDLPAALREAEAGLALQPEEPRLRDFHDRLVARLAREGRPA
jgi:tetratricopeptide (TPR) repeat protein